MMDMIVFSGVSILILILLHVFLGRAVIKYSNKLKNDFKLKQAKLRDSEELIKSLPDPQKAIEDIEKKSEEFKEMGVSRKQLPRLVQLLGKSISEHNINVISLKPREDIKSVDENLPAGVSKVYIEMVISGSYQTIGDYIKVLSALPVTFVIESMSVEKKQVPVAPGEEKKAAAEARPESEELLCSMILSTYAIWEL